MKRSSRFALVACTLVLASLFLHAGVAAACTQQCVRISTFCKQCEDTGEYTGVTCQSSGSCGCFYTQNTCGLAASGIKAQDGLAAVIQTDKSAVCSAEPVPTSDVDIFLR